MLKWSQNLTIDEKAIDFRHPRDVDFMRMRPYDMGHQQRKHECQLQGGWVKLSSIKPYKDKEGYKIISGNFEFSFQDEENDRHHIKYGNFDTK